MNRSHRDTDANPDRSASSDPGAEIPRQPKDSTAEGDARNDTGEDNQRQKGERPASDYIRR